MCVCACVFVFSYIKMYGVKRLNRIQNKSFHLQNICLCTVVIYYVCINAHTFTHIFRKYLHVYIYIIYKYILYIYTHNIFFIYACVCIYIYIITLHSTHLYIM